MWSLSWKQECFQILPVLVLNTDEHELFQVQSTISLPELCKHGVLVTASHSDVPTYQILVVSNVVFETLAQTIDFVKVTNLEDLIELIMDAEITNVASEDQLQPEMSSRVVLIDKKSKKDDKHSVTLKHVQGVQKFLDWLRVTSWQSITPGSFGIVLKIANGVMVVKIPHFNVCPVQDQERQVWEYVSSLHPRGHTPHVVKLFQTIRVNSGKIHAALKVETENLDQNSNLPPDIFTALTQDVLTEKEITSLTSWIQSNFALIFECHNGKNAETEDQITTEFQRNYNVCNGMQHAKIKALCRVNTQMHRNRYSNTCKAKNWVPCAQFDQLSELGKRLITRSENINELPTLFSKLYNANESIDIFFAGFEEGGELASFLSKHGNSKKHSLASIQRVVFQTFYTLAAMRAEYPNLALNDMHTSNVFIRRHKNIVGKDTQSTIYDLNGQSWKLPYANWDIVLADYGSSQLTAETPCPFVTKNEIHFLASVCARVKDSATLQWLDSVAAELLMLIPDVNHPPSILPIREWMSKNPQCFKNMAIDTQETCDWESILCVSCSKNLLEAKQNQLYCVKCSSQSHALQSLPGLGVLLNAQEEKNDTTILSINGLWDNVAALENRVQLLLRHIRNGHYPRISWALLILFGSWILKIDVSTYITQSHYSTSEQQNLKTLTELSFVLNFGTVGNKSKV